MEDASALRPVPLHASSNQVLVAGDKEEVVIDQLLPGSLSHAQKRVVGTGQVLAELSESGLHEALNGQTLLLGDTGGESEAVNAPSNPDPGGLDRSGGINVALDLVNIHVTLVPEVGLESMVVQDDGLKDILEVLVGVGIAGINAAVLIIEVNGASDGLNKVHLLSVHRN